MKSDYMLESDCYNNFGRETLHRLLAVDSVTGHEQEIQKVVRQILHEMECDDIQEITANLDKISKDSEYISSGFSSQERPNLVGTWQGKEPQVGKSLMFMCHVDTVSIGEEKNWSRDTHWQEENGRIYGRGSSDMKGGLVAALIAIKAVRDAKLPLRGNIKLCASVEEESGGGAGALAVFREGVRADAVIAPEPQMRMAIACAGVSYMRIHVRGQSAHGARSHTGVNAIEKLIIIYQALKQLGENRRLQVKNPWLEKDAGFACGYNIGAIHSGDWPSTVPDSGYLEARYSFAPGETMEGLRSEILSALNSTGDDWLSAHPPEVEWFGWQSCAWEQDKEHPFIHQFMDSFRTVMSEEPEVFGKSCGLDIRFCGRYGIPALSFGPVGGNIHGADEWVDFQSILDCAKIYYNILAQWCL